MLIRSSVSRFLNRVFLSRGSVFVPAFDALVPRHRNILAVLSSDAGETLIPASNIVTDAGDIYYAQKGAGEATTNAFGIHELGSAVTATFAKTHNRSNMTVIGSTQKAHSATYPKRNDADADNTGAGTKIVTYLASYAKADFNHAAITHGIITNATPGATEPILTGYAFAASFAKTANDTLKVFVNHAMTGV